MATLFDQKGKVTPGVGNSLYSDTPEWGGRVWRDANTGAVLNGEPGATAAEQDVDYYRNLAQQWANTQAPQVDWSGAKNSLAQGLGYTANNGQEAQLSALNQTYGLASGRSTSLASGAAQQQLDNSVAGSYAAGASALGGSLGQAAALRGAAQNEAGMRAIGQQQMDIARANEMAQARQLYAQQANDYRQANAAALGAANSIAGAYAQNAQQRANLQMGQNELNQAGQLANEQNAYNVNKAQLDALQQGQDLQAQAYEARRRGKAATNAIVTGAIGAGIGAVSSGLAAGGKAGSDERMKQPVSLGHAAHMRLWK